MPAGSAGSPVRSAGPIWPTHVDSAPCLVEKQEALHHCPTASCWPRRSGPFGRSRPASSLACPCRCPRGRLSPTSLRTGDGVAVRKLCELRVGEKCCVVGTLFKAMQLQPSILQEISEEVTAGTFPPVGPPHSSSTRLGGDVPAHTGSSAASHRFPRAGCGRASGTCQGFDLGGWGVISVPPPSLNATRFGASTRRVCACLALLFLPLEGLDPAGLAEEEDEGGVLGSLVYPCRAGGPSAPRRLAGSALGSLEPARHGMRLAPCLLGRVQRQRGACPAGDCKHVSRGEPECRLAEPLPPWPGEPCSCSLHWGAAGKR